MTVKNLFSLDYHGQLDLFSYKRVFFIAEKINIHYITYFKVLNYFLFTKYRIVVCLQSSKFSFVYKVPSLQNKIIILFTKYY